MAERHGYDRSAYTYCAFAAFLVGVAISWTLQLGFRVNPILAMPIPFATILLNHAIHELMGSMSTTEEVAARIAETADFERRVAGRQALLDELYRTGICLKTYASTDQQYEYLNDREALDRAGIAYAVKQAGITNLFVAAADAERAAGVLGLRVADAGPDDGEATARDAERGSA
jgi:hypothetical protein